MQNERSSEEGETGAPLPISTRELRSTIQQHRAPHALQDLYDRYELKHRVSSAMKEVQTMQGIPMDDAEYNEFIEEPYTKEGSYRGPDVVLKRKDRETARLVPKRDPFKDGSTLRPRCVRRAGERQAVTGAQLTATSMVDFIPWTTAVITGRGPAPPPMASAVEPPGAFIMNRHLGSKEWTRAIVRTKADASAVTSAALARPIDIDLGTAPTLVPVARHLRAPGGDGPRVARDIFATGRDEEYAAWRRSTAPAVAGGHAPIVRDISVMAPHAQTDWSPRVSYWAKFHRRPDLTDAVPASVQLSRGEPNNLGRPVTAEEAAAAFTDSASLSPAAGRAVFIEHIDQNPPLPTLVGMVSRLETVLTGTATAGHLAGRVRRASAAELDGGLMGRLPPNSATSTVSNDLATTPVHPEPASHTDFLLVFGRAGRVPTCSVRPLQHVFAAGQQVPRVSVYHPRKDDRKAYQQALARVYCTRRARGEVDTDDGDGDTLVTAMELIEKLAPDVSVKKVQRIMERFATRRPGTGAGDGETDKWEVTQPASDAEMATLTPPEAHCRAESMRAGQYALRRWAQQAGLDGQVWHALTARKSVKARVTRLVTLTRFIAMRNVLTPWVQTDLWVSLRGRLSTASTSTKAYPNVVDRGVLMSITDRANWVCRGDAVMLAPPFAPSRFPETPLLLRTADVTRQLLAGDIDGVLGVHAGDVSRIQGTDSDLRNLHIKEVISILASLGMPEIAMDQFRKTKPSRWEWVEKLKDVAQDALIRGDNTGLAAKYARGGRAGTMVPLSNIQHTLSHTTERQLQMLRGGGDAAGGMVAVLDDTRRREFARFLDERADDTDSDDEATGAGTQRAAEPDKPPPKRQNPGQPYQELQAILDGRKVVVATRTLGKDKATAETITIREPALVMAYALMTRPCEELHAAIKDLPKDSVEGTRSRRPAININDILTRVLDRLGSFVLPEVPEDAVIRRTFWKRVSATQWKDYEKVIGGADKHAYLAELHNKLSQGRSVRSPEFIKKIRQILINAYKYNKPGLRSSWTLDKTVEGDTQRDKMPNGVLATAEMLRLSVIGLLEASLPVLIDEEVSYDTTDRDRAPTPESLVPLHLLMEGPPGGPEIVADRYPLFSELFGSIRFPRVE